MSKTQPSITYATYDARTEALSYYAQAYPDGNHISNLQLDQLKAASEGVLLWSPSLVLISWPQSPGHLWVELAVGYIHNLPALLKHPHHYHTISYIKHGRTVTHSADRISKRLQ